MPNVQRVLETALYVADVQRAAAFYKRLFNFESLLETDRLIALDVAGNSVLLLFKAGATRQPFTTPGGTIPGHGDARAGSNPTHFAFAIAREDLESWRQHLQSLDVTIEGEMNWPPNITPNTRGGATSLYFRDPDENLVELITPGFWRTF